MILIDLQKAFEAIDHKIRLEKRFFVGSSELTIKWFNSYRSERQFKVNWNGTFSEPGMGSCGAPQGSILGPLLFLIYINDISNGLESNVKLFADDASLFSIVFDPSLSAIKLNNDLKSGWPLDF